MQTCIPRDIRAPKHISLDFFLGGNTYHSRLRNVVDDQRRVVEPHTYMYLPYGHVTNGDLSAALEEEDG